MKEHVVAYHKREKESVTIESIKKVIGWFYPGISKCEDFTDENIRREFSDILIK